MRWRHHRQRRIAVATMMMMMLRATSTSTSTSTTRRLRLRAIHVGMVALKQAVRHRPLLKFVPKDEEGYPLVDVAVNERIIIERRRREPRGIRRAERIARRQHAHSYLADAVLRLQEASGALKSGGAIDGKHEAERRAECAIMERPRADAVPAADAATAIAIGARRPSLGQFARVRITRRDHLPKPPRENIEPKVARAEWIEVRTPVAASAVIMSNFGACLWPRRPNVGRKKSLERMELARVMAGDNVAVKKVDIIPRQIVIVEEESVCAHALVAIFVATRLLDARMDSYSL